MEQENKKKSKIIIIFLIIIIVILLGALCFEMFNNRNNKNTKTNNTNKTEEKITKIEPKENYNGTLIYDEEKRILDEYVRDEKLNEVKKEIPTVEDIINNYLSIRESTRFSESAITKSYVINPSKLSDEDKVWYYALGTAKKRGESEVYKLDSINEDLADSVFGDRIEKVKAESNSAFKYNSNNKTFTSSYLEYPGLTFGNYIRIIDLNKKGNNYILRIKIGDIVGIEDDIYYIGGIKATYDESSDSYKNSTRLVNYKMEDESLLDTIEIELKPYSNSYKYVISNISLK